MKLQYRIAFLSLIFLSYFNIQSRQADINAAYNISLPNQQGNIVSLDKNVGKYVYLHFWASWCEQSLLQLPILNDIYAHYHAENFGQADGFEIYSVSLDANKNEWLHKLAANQLIWPQQVCDFKSYASPVCRQYKITSTPASFLISPNGTIIAQDISPKELELFLDEHHSKARYGSSRAKLIQTFSQNANQPIYKIQLGVFKYPNLQKFAHIQHLGAIETEQTPEGYTRVMLGSFSSEATTNAVLEQIKNQANCQQAFVLAVPNDILPTTANENDFWATAQDYNAGITPTVSQKTKDKGTFYDQDFASLMSQPIIEPVAETIIPDYGISDDVFSKPDNRKIKVTIYAPKEQAPSIRIVETESNEASSPIAIGSDIIYNPNKTVVNKPETLATTSKNTDTKKNELIDASTNIVQNEVNVPYGISESYTKPNEIGTPVLKPIATKPTVATVNQPNKDVDKQPAKDIPAYDYSAAPERTKQKETTDKNGSEWTAPEYYPSDHNKEWRDLSVAKKASDTQSDANWDPKNQSPMPAPPKVEKQTKEDETEKPKGKVATYNYSDKKKDSKAVKAIPNSENFKWEPKKSHTYPTTYPRKETELPLPANVNVPTYDYPKSKKEKQTKKDENEELEKTKKMTRKERRRKRRQEKKQK